MQLRPLAAAIALAALAFAGVAPADTVEVDDNRNTRANLLDIKAVSAGHRGALIEHRIDTYRAWRSRELRRIRRRPRAVCIYVWKQGRDAGSRQDYEACARYSDGELRGRVLRVRPRRKVTGRLFIRRLSLRSITYRFEKRAIGGPRSYQWQAVTGYTGKGCPRDPPFQFGCDDSAPTRAVRLHDLDAPESDGSGARRGQ
jgi:hypothetical protein